MADQNPEDDNKDKKRFNKFNSFWIYGLAALILFATQFLFQSNFSSPEDITIERLGEFASNGDVDQVIVVNKKEAHVYLTQEAAKSDRHSGANQNKFNPSGPNYTFNIGSVDLFAGDIRRINESLPPENQIVLRYEEEINIVRLIRDQRWMLAAVKKLMSEKSVDIRKEVHK